MHVKQNITKNHSAHTRDMTQGNPYSLMLGFALPIFLSQVFQQLYNTADAFIVGKNLGTNALAAVTSSGTLIFLMISFFAGIAMGAGVVISRYFGAGDEEQVSGHPYGAGLRPGGRRDSDGSGCCVYAHLSGLDAD